MSRLSRPRALLAVLSMALVTAFGTACGSSTDTPAASGGASSNSATPSAGVGATATATPTPAQCASAGTRKFQKTRLVADLGLSYGAFHRYLLKPYQAGTFKKGANGRTTAIIKATVASAAIAKLVKNARDNAAADPTLCKYVPEMDSLRSGLSGIGGLLGGAGAATGLAQADGIFGKLKGILGFTDSTSTLPGLG